MAMATEKQDLELQSDRIRITADSSEQSAPEESSLELFPYTEAEADLWDELIDQAPMATFLHTRCYLSYHADRFQDLSLLIKDEKHRLLGLFLAAIDPSDSSRVVSHPGLTYGGLLHQGGLKGEKMLRVWHSLQTYYAEQGFQTLRYKAVPSIYHSVPSADDLYALFRLGAVRYRCELACAIDLANRPELGQRRRRGLKKALNHNVQVKEGVDLVEPFWKVLAENLARKLSTSPIHSLSEIIHLHSLFPNHIEFAIASYENQIVAGTVLFCSRQVFRAQYIASSPLGNKLCALDAVFEHCIAKAKAQNVRFFDFGTSNQNEGQHLQASLYNFKAEFGGGGVVQECYEIPLATSKVI
jgi:dsDNA-binding SOS-regulon protein